MRDDHRQGSAATAPPPQRHPAHASGGNGNGNGHSNGKGTNRNGRIVTGGNDKKVEVLVPGLHPTPHGPLDWSSDQFADAVLGALPDGLLYRSAKSVGVITGSAGCREFDPADATDFILYMGEHVGLAQWERHEGRLHGARITCRDHHARLVLKRAYRSGKARPLFRLVHYPVYGPSFELMKPGWTDGTFYDPPPAIASLRPIDEPTVIREVLEELVCDFPFKDAASRENFFGLLLTPILRPALDGNVPMHMVMAPLERTGKSKLLEEVLGGVVLGHPTPSSPVPETEDEFKKDIISRLLDGETLVHLDNVGRFLDSAVLASLLTSSLVSGRLLGKSQSLRLPNTLTVTASANNPQATGEMVKRTIPINLQPPDDHPEDRDNFAHPDLREYVREQRLNVLGVLLGMVEIWKARGRPSGTVRMGGFENWARVIGGVMRANGFEHWMANFTEWRRRADSDKLELVAFVRAWAETYGQTRQTASDLLRLAQAHSLFGMVIRGDSASSNLSRFSKRVLSRNLDTPIGVEGRQYLMTVDESGNNRTYWLNGAEGSGTGMLPTPEHDRAPPPDEPDLPY